MDFSYIIIPIIVVIASQAIKLATDGIRGNFDFRNFLSFYGGMPSSHTAFAVSITTLVGLRAGFEAPIFAVALVFTLLIMRDAVALRNVIGKQSALLNRLQARLLPSEQPHGQHLRERMGHSTSEVAAGAVLGIVATWLLGLL